MPSTKIPKSVGEPSISRHDSRSDLGYGRISNKFHKPRKESGTFPYLVDQYSEIDWEDEETHAAIEKKIQKHQRSDPFMKKSTSPFYFAAGNTKLSDCFQRTEEVLEEIHSLGDSMSPIPHLTKKRREMSGGSSVHSGGISSSSAKRTGSEKGYASAPPDIKYDKNDNDHNEVIFNLEDLVKKLQLKTGNFRYRKT
jgi:hypothetical protein